jgi:hypothetical protein
VFGKQLNPKVVISINDEKLKSNGKLPAKSRRQKIVNDASRSKNSKCPKSSPKEKFHNENRQWSNSHKSMSFPPYGSSMPMPWEPYFNMHYFCPPWHYSSYMSCPSYFCQTHREPVINEPSPMRNDYFDHKNRSTQQSKRKVIKQVYRVKKDSRLNKNSDLTLDIKCRLLKNHRLVLLIKLSLIMSMS